MLMRIKLKDLTEEQYKKWKLQNCCVGAICEECIFSFANCICENNKCWIKNKDLFTDKFLEQEIEVEVEPILTEKEREYLNAVIKPFRNSAGYIAKIPIKEIKKAEFIQIGYNGEWFSLPPFEPGEYYENMELYKKYTLEELDL